MAKPIILITAGKQNPATPQGEVQAATSGCDLDYIQSVARAGGAPVILPRMAEKDAIGAAVEVAEGVLLTGGGDILSLAYGEEPHLASKGQDPIRDEMEFEVVRVALERELPILGVCRGAQLLNVALGGTLIQDLPSQVPGALKHYSEGLDTVLLHSIEIEAGSLLARVLGTTSLAVNSWHHQAVREVGQGLRVNSRARDGVIEGLESTESRPILAVQFHPEECTAAYPRFQALFDWLVREASARRRGGAA